MASIYVVDVEHNRWSKLVGSLVTIIKDNSEAFIPVSLTVLSRICDLLYSLGGLINKDMLGEDAECIVGSLFMCIEERVSNKDLRLNALKSLRLAADFVGDVLEKHDARAYVMKLILFNLNIKDEDIVCLTYQFLIELVKPIYLYLDDNFIRDTMQISRIHLDSRNPNTPIIACEFWAALANEEAYRKVYFEVESV